MVGILLLWAVNALALWVVVGLVGGVEKDRNNYADAFITSAILWLGQAVFIKLGISTGGILWAIAWLWIVKTRYDIGWMRAIGIWVVLAILMVALFFITLPLGLFALGLGLL